MSRRTPHNRWRDLCLSPRHDRTAPRYVPAKWERRPDPHLDPQISTLQPLRHAGAGELPEGVLSHPSCGGILRVRQPARCFDSGGVEGAIALADRPKGHVDGLLDEIA